MIDVLCLECVTEGIPETLTTLTSGQEKMCIFLKKMISAWISCL